MPEILAELAAPPILVLPDWDDGSRPSHVYCDAFIDGFGTALEQEQPDGSVRPIAYISGANLDSERQWTPLDLKAGSIVWTIKRLRGYLWGTKFRIFGSQGAQKHRQSGKSQCASPAVSRVSHRVRLHPRISCPVCQSLPRNTTALDLAASPQWNMAVSSSFGPAGFAPVPLRSPVLA